MYLLDIGGGFPGSEDVKLKFEEVIHNNDSVLELLWQVPFQNVKTPQPIPKETTPMKVNVLV